MSTNKYDDVIRLINTYVNQQNDSNDTLKAINETVKTLIDAHAPGVGTGLSYFINKKFIERIGNNIKLTDEALNVYDRSLYAFTMLLSDCIDKDTYKRKETEIENYFSDFTNRNKKPLNNLINLLCEVNNYLDWHRLEAYMSHDSIKQSLKSIDRHWSTALNSLNQKQKNTEKKQNNFDFNNIPKSRLIYFIRRNDVIQKIIDNQESCFLLHADGGYGKSTVIRQVSENSSFLSRFDYGYAYSFYNQSNPNDDSEINYVDSVDFFHKIITQLPVNIESVKKIIRETQQVFEKFEGNELENLADTNLVDHILSKGAGVDGFWAEVLFRTLLEKKVLLFIDGMEVVQDKDGNITDTNNELRIFLNKLNNPIDSKVIITSRKEANIGAVEQLKEFTEDDVKTALESNRFLKSDIEAIGDKIHALTVPIILNFVIVLVKQSGSTIEDALDNINTKNNQIFKLDSRQTGQQSESIIKAILEQIRSIWVNRDEGKVFEFMKVASLFDRPMNINEYGYLQKNFSELLPEKIPNKNDFFFLDTNDAIPSVDMHPMVSKVLYNMIKGEDNFKSYTETMAAYYLKIYELTENVEKRYAIYRAIDFWNKAGNIEAIENAFIDKINNTNHIKKYAEHPRAYSVLKILTNNQEKLKNKLNIFKSYIFFAMTLGNSNEAINLIENVDTVKIVNEGIEKATIETKRKTVKNYDFKDEYTESDDETFERIYCYTQEVDWYMSVIENYKYTGQEIEQEIENNIKRLLVQETKSYIEKFWRFQLKMRCEEYRYYISNSKGKYKTSIDKLLFYFKKNFFGYEDSNWPAMYIKHPHDLWFERYYSAILDDCIDKKLKNETEDTSYIKQEFVNIQQVRKEKFKSSPNPEEPSKKISREPYYQQGLINILKYKCYKLLTSNNEIDDIPEGVYEGIKVEIEKVNMKITKNDFILQSLLDMALCDTLLNIEVNNDFLNRIQNMINKTDNEFYKLDFELLKFLRGKKTKEAMDVFLSHTKYEHRNRRYDAFKTWRDSPS